MAKTVQFIQSNAEPSAYIWEGATEPIAASGFLNVIGDDRHMLTKEFVNYCNGLYKTVFKSEPLSINEENIVSKEGIPIGSLGEMAYTRFISNSTEIWRAVQDKKGLKPTTLRTPSLPLDRATPGDEIYIQDGSIHFDLEHSNPDKAKYLYMMIHNQNESNPFRDNAVAFAQFKLNDLQKKAESGIESEDIKMQAREIVYQLRDKKNKTFNFERLDFYSKIFKSRLAGMETPEEKFRALLSIADHEPEAIINTVENKRSDYAAVIQAALDLGVITKSKGSLINSESNNVIATVAVGATTHQIIEKLIDVFITDAGDVEYNYIKNILAKKKSDA